MLNDQSEILDHFTGYKSISSLDRWQKRYVSSLARLVYAIYEQVHGAYIKIMSQQVRAQNYAMIEYEERIRAIEDMLGIPYDEDVSALCRGFLKVMEEDNETNIVCQNGHGPETWHSMDINGDKGAITLLEIG
jgi:hypothetical protein